VIQSPDFDKACSIYSDYGGRIVLINKVVIEAPAFKYFTITLRTQNIAMPLIGTVTRLQQTKTI
jgi:hypothetical protein